METAKGVVEGVFSRKTATGKNIWSFKLNGDPRFYRTSFTRPSFEEGMAVEFNYEEDKYGNQVAMPSVKVLKSFVEPAPASDAAGGKTSSIKENYEARAKYWEDKEKRDILVQAQIRWQASNNSAIAFLNLAHATGVLPAPSARAKDKFGALMDLLNKVREDFISGASMEGAGVAEAEATVDKEQEEESDEGWEN